MQCRQIRTREAGHFPNNEVFKTSNFFQRLVKQVDCWSAIRPQVTGKTGLQDTVQYIGRYIYYVALTENLSSTYKSGICLTPKNAFQLLYKTLTTTRGLESLYTRYYYNL
jgi:hypothetical protein